MLKTDIICDVDRTIITASQDCTPHAEFAKAQHNAGFHGSSEVKHAAHLPDVIVEKYMNDHGVTFEEIMGNPVHIRRMCMDPDNAAFRIWKGRL